MDDNVRPSHSERMPASTRAALSDFVGQRSWDVMFTATFATKCRYPRQAIETTLRDIPVCRKYFIAAEPHRLGGYHTHGLIEFNGGADFDHAAGYVQDHMRKRGYARVEEVRSVGAVSAYVCKYMTKTLGDWDIGGQRIHWKNNLVRGLDKSRYVGV